MVDRIGRLYTDPAGPVQPTGKPTQQGKEVAKTAPERPVRDLPVAARLLPDLQDRVEISEEARAAAQTEEVNGGEIGVSDARRKAISDSWYAAGYAYALELIDKS